jgi:hypothetical protein
MTWLRAGLCLVVLLLPVPVAAEPAALQEYLRIRRAIEVASGAAALAELEREAAAARESLLASAHRDSRLLVTTERRGDHEGAPALETARLVARDGRVTLQALAGPRPQSPRWERAGVVEPGPYRALLERLLRDPALAADWPTPRFDPNAPGPRRAVVVRLAVGTEEREMQALAGPPYERLAALAATLLEFCRTVPLAPAR